MEPKFDFWKDIASIVGAAIACFTLIKGLIEYIAQGRQKRAEHFFNLRKKLKEKESFRSLCVKLDHEQDVSEIPPEDKRDFLGLIEEVAVMKNSTLINKNLAFYMFGYYAIKCWESETFWSDFKRESPYWKVFRAFAEDARQFQKTKMEELKADEVIL